MDQLKKKNVKDFTRGKAIQQNSPITRKVRNTLYRTKPGSYCPPPYQLKFRKLSEVLNKLLAMFKTDQITQEEVDCECELVREELYNERQDH